MYVRRSIGLAAIVLCPAANAAGMAVDRPVTVSPGEVTTIGAAPALCPTFSWAGVDKARSYEIVVYEMAAAEEMTAARGREPALSVAVPGSASSWTPAADRCLAAATEYVWFVRALGKRNAVGEWSEGGMFRTPPAQVTRDLRDEVLRIVERYLAVAPPAAAPGSTGLPAVSRPTAPGGRLPESSSEARPPWKLTARSPDGSEEVALRSAGEVVSAPSIGLYGWTNNNWDDSTGVAGYAAVTGRGFGVAGYTTSGEGAAVLGQNEASSHGTGVFGQNLASDHGVGVMGYDAASSDLSGGVVGLSENPNGYGGFFWNYASGGGGSVVLAVAEPVGDPPTSANPQFTVRTNGDIWGNGNLGLEAGIDVGGDVRLLGAGNLQFVANDSPTACDSSLEGAIYYDASEQWLCICSKAATAFWKWRRADDKTVDCSPPPP